MKKIPKVTYQTAEEIEAVIAQREAGLKLLPPGEGRSG